MKIGSRREKRDKNNNYYYQNIYIAEGGVRQK